MNNNRGNAMLIILGIISLTSVFLYTMLPLLTRGQQTNMLTAYESDTDNIYDLATAILSSPTTCSAALTTPVGAALVPVASPMTAAAQAAAPWTIPGTQIVLSDAYGRVALKKNQIYNSRVLVQNIQLYDLGTVNTLAGVDNAFHYAAVTIQMVTVNQPQPFQVTKTIYLYVVANAAGNQVSTCDISAQVSTLAAAWIEPIAGGVNVTGNMLMYISGAGTYSGIVPSASNINFKGTGSVGNGGGKINASGCVPEYVNGNNSKDFSYGFQTATAGSPTTYTQTPSGIPGYPSNCVTISGPGPLIWNEAAYQDEMAP
jgi:hypothetical protein